MRTLEPCPMCNSIWGIERRVMPKGICNVNLCCDKCGFHAPRAITVRGAERRWNRYVTSWRKGFEAVKPIILADLDRKLEKMREKALREEALREENNHDNH